MAGGGVHNPPSRGAVCDERKHGSVGAGAGATRPGYPTSALEGARVEPVDQLGEFLGGGPEAERDDRKVAEGIVRSGSAEIAKAVARAMHDFRAMGVWRAITAEARGS